MSKAKLKSVVANSGKHLTPQPAVQISSEQKPPVFCLRYLRKGYCLSECERDDKAAFAQTLYNLTQLTWAEIKTTQRHGLGTEKIAQNSIRGDTIPSHISAEVTFLAIRFSGMKAMVGYREGPVYHILWLDKDFTLYAH